MKKYMAITIFTFTMSLIIHLAAYFPELHLKLAYFAWLHILTMLSFASMAIYSGYLSLGKNEVLEGIKLPAWVIILFLISIVYFVSFIALNGSPKYLKGELINEIVNGEEKYYRVWNKEITNVFSKEEYWGIHSMHLKFFSLFWSFFSFLAMLIYYGVIPLLKEQVANKQLQPTSESRG